MTVSQGDPGLINLCDCAAINAASLIDKNSFSSCIWIVSHQFSHLSFVYIPFSCPRSRHLPVLAHVVEFFFLKKKTRPSGLGLPSWFIITPTLYRLFRLPPFIHHRARWLHSLSPATMSSLRLATARLVLVLRYLLPSAATSQRR